MENHANRKALIVLGMHRSGTSAMAGLMGEMGCDLPKDLMAPKEMNAKGFFESNKITYLNEDILTSAGMSWFDLNPFPDAWYSSLKAADFRARARMALQDEFGGSSLFVMKDPRNCRLMPFWEDVLTEVGVQPVYICVHRDPIEVAASLQKWAGYEPLYGQLLWLRHVIDAEFATRGKKRVFVSYDQLLSDWRGVVSSISSSLDLVFPSSIRTSARGVQGFLSKDLKHLTSEKLLIPNLKDSSEWMAKTWEVLNRWSRTGEDTTDHVTFDNIREAMNAASATMVTVADELLARHRESEHQASQLEHQASQLEHQASQLEQSSTALVDCNTRLGEAKHALHETFLKKQQLHVDLNSCAHEFYKARSRPFKNLLKYYEFITLRMMSSNSSPLPSKMKSRFSGSAKKRNPDRYLPRNEEHGVASKNDTADMAFVKGKMAFRPDLPSAIIVTHDASRTGAPILALNLAKALSDRYNIIIVCLRAGDLVADFQQVSSEVYLAQPGNVNTKYFIQMLDQISSRKPPAFAVINSIESRHILGALKERQIPNIALFHEFASYTLPKSAFTDAFYLADQIVFSSELTIQNALEQTSFVRTPRFHVLAQGRCEVPRHDEEQALRKMERDRLTEQLRPNGLNSNDFLVIGAGYVQMRKGVDLFIDVARRVLSTEEGQNARFAWIGAGYDPEHDAAYSVYLRDQIDRAGLSDKMLMLGETSEIEHVYALSNLLLLTSRLDPLPNVAIDALSEGVPVVCFEKSSGIAGLLADAGLQDTCVADYLDTTQAAAKVLQFIGDPEVYQKVCNTSKVFAARTFNFGAYASRVEELALRAGKTWSLRPEDVSMISTSQDFDSDFFMPQHRRNTSRKAAAEYYLAASWRETCPRRPEPGFNQLVYARHLLSEGGADVDPYIAFLQRGRPPGPWLRTVIRESTDDSLPEGRAPLKTALHIHAYYPDVVGAIAQRLALNKTQPDIFINAGDSKSLDAAVEKLRGYQGRIVEARVVTNRGRDIGSLLTEFGDKLVSDYDLIGHIHTKKSEFIVDRVLVDQWVNFLYENMIGGKHGGAMMDRILAALTLNERIGIAFPADPNNIAWSKNEDVARKLAPSLGVDRFPEFFDFPIGSMFWIRAAALQPFVALGLAWKDYPPEPVRSDGSVLHAMERLFGVVAESRCLEVAVTNVKGITR